MHRAAHVRVRYLGHKDDNGVLCLRVKLARHGAGQVEHVPRPLHHGKLKPKADAQKWDFGLMHVLYGKHHAFRSTLAEPAWPTGIVIPRGSGFLHL